jgi:hypothetical protein
MLIFFTFFIVVLRLNSHFINFVICLDALAYLEIAIFILSFCVAAFFAQRKHVLEDICLIPERKTVIAKGIATLAVLNLICILPILYAVISAILEKADLLYFGISLAYVFVRWLLIVTISHSLGFLCGLILKKHFVYILACPFSVLFSYLNIEVFSRISKTDSVTAVSELFSVQKAFMTAVEIDYIGGSSISSKER